MIPESEAAPEVVAETPAETPPETPTENPSPEAGSSLEGKETLAGGEVPKAETPETPAEEPKSEPAKEAEDETPAGWPEDWRERIADHASAGNKKEREKELRRLNRLTGIEAIYGAYREAEARLHGGGLVKVPGKDASEDDLANFRKALGVPEKAEDYFDSMELANGAVIGDADKPAVEGFLSALHEAGAPPQIANAALNWYYANQEQAEAEIDQRDEDFRKEAATALEEEYGANLKRYTGAIGGLFSTMPGGSDFKNEGSLFNRLLAGRTADGQIIGNDPDVMRWLVSLAQEVNPMATVTDVDGPGSKSIDDELKEIDEFRRTNKAKYFKDEKMQARNRELLAAQQKMQARS